MSERSIRSRDSGPDSAERYGNLVHGLPSAQFFFDDWKGPEDVITLCELCVQQLKRIVADGQNAGFLKAWGIRTGPEDQGPLLRRSI
jgi:hypothetical protein